ncbi:MGMT family protein [Flavobacterium agricola]|uniref:MGMT family protein n=1 Tax=Flavobacterium agricola TaxID=2870839 RepID=A0ABY6M1K4_9FLAO|nr:MGMT family protein [Flavobacterium agricola]UYW01285.1 MGMT family protein [Flavobacterium agricola]
MKELSFFDKVYELVQQIPHGKVTTYGAIANKLGAPQASRAVGYALNHSKNLENIPAHRVVNRKGLLTGKIHFMGTNLMQQLLESEGLEIKNNQIQNLEQHLWLP